MKKQNQIIEDGFVVEQESPKGPFYLLPSQRITNLQNQVIFYEGQVDPLQMQNFNLKENVVRLSRQVSLNTDVLRKLLPNENDPIKKHKLEMASFTQVTQSINQTWKLMQNQLAALMQSQNQVKRQLQKCRLSLKQQQTSRHQQKLQYQSKISQIQSNYQSLILSLQTKLNNAEINTNTLKKNFQQQLKIKQKQIQKYQKQIQFSRHDFNFRSRQYETAINRLKNNIQAFLHQSQQSKASLKALYQKISNEKLTEQGQTYQFMLRIKEEEKRRIESDMIEMRTLQIKELNQKELDVNKMREQFQRQKLFIVQIQDQLYQKREEMKGVRSQTKEMRDQIIKLKQNCIIFQNNVKKRQETIDKLQQQLASTISQFESKIKGIEQAHFRYKNEATNQKNKLLTIIQQLQSEIREFKARINKIQEQFTKKNKLQIQKYKEKELQLKKFIQKQQKDIQFEKDKINKIEEQKQDQVKRWKQHFQEVIKKLQKDFQKKKDEYVKEQVIKAARDSSKFEQQQIKYRLQCQMQIENAKQQNEEQIQRVRQDFFNLINQKEVAFQKQKRTLQQKIQLLQNEKSNLNEQIAKLNKKIQQGQQKMQKMKTNHIRQVAKLQQKNNQTVITWQNTLQNQLDQFQKVMMERQMKIGQIQDSFARQKQELNLKMQNQLKEVAQAKQHNQKQMKVFKQKSGIRQVQLRFQNDIKNLKAASLARQKQQHLSFIKEKILLIDQHTKDKNNVIFFYTKQLSKVQKFLEQTLVNINILLFKIACQHEFNQSQKRQQISLLNNANKIENIENQIKIIQELLQQKKEQLSNARDKLQRIERSIEEALIERKAEIQRERLSIINQMQAKMQQKIKQYIITTAKKQAQHRLKQEQLQRERSRFVQLLHQQFTNLRESHQKDYSKLLQKYIEIQNYFQNRPSRGQDIAKIKELNLKNNKLTKQVHVLQKRYDTANEIVKYLNLQLQNYKEMYDIFKPAQGANKTISFNFDSQKAEKYHRIVNKLRDQHNKTLAKRKHLAVDITPFFQQRVKEEIDKNGNKVTNNKTSAQGFGKQFKFFAERSQGQQQLALQSKQSQKKVRKYSFVPMRNRLKTEVSPNKQSQIFQNTQTFLKLANVQMNDNFPKQKQIQKKQGYRRRKIKRMSTGIQQFT